jgi:hypothetical protein
LFHCCSWRKTEMVVVEAVVAEVVEAVVME